MSAGIGAVTGAVSGGVGAAVGAVVGSSVGSVLGSAAGSVIGGTVAGAAAGGAGYVVGSVLSGEEMTWAGAGQAIGTGALIGGVAGAAGAVSAAMKPGTTAKPATSTKPVSSVKPVTEEPLSTGSKPGVCSFTGNTAVLMADGSQKPIRDVGVGDEVTSTDPGDGVPSDESVTAVWPHVDQIWTVTLTDGSVVESTANHPWWVASERGFVRTDHLVVGDQLLTGDGTTITVTKVIQTDRWESTWNLTVTGPHTYHIGQDNILVHNCGTTGLTSNQARLQAMREAGIPTSQQPEWQMKTEAGYTYAYRIPKPGGGTQIKIVSQETTDFHGTPPEEIPPGHGPHWEAGSPKVDDEGGFILDPLGRPRILNGKGTSSPKVKVAYGGQAGG